MEEFENLSKEEREYALQQIRQKRRQERKQEKEKEKRSVEFSKAVMMFVSIMAFTVLTLGCWKFFKYGNLDHNYVNWASAVLAWSGVSFAFYAWKARGENISKGKLTEVQIQNGQEVMGDWRESV